MTKKQEEPKKLTPVQFLSLWVTQLQAHITRQVGEDEPKFMVKGYGDDDALFTELDIFIDDASCVECGDWFDPQLWYGPATLEIRNNRLEPFNGMDIIKRNGGKVTPFDVEGHPEVHFEIELNGETYGPMIETELYWFAHGITSVTPDASV